MEMMHSTSYYDRLLAGMVLSLGIGAGIGLLTAVPANLGVSLGALAASALMYDGMFRHAPISAAGPEL